MQDRRHPMPEDKFTRALKNANEIEITVIGRNTGKPVTLPVWFVHENDTLWLLPVNGSKTQWYQNLLKKPTITIKVGKEERTLNAQVLKTATSVGKVIQSFQQKYTPEMIAKYYPGPLDVTIKLKLQPLHRYKTLPNKGMPKFSPLAHPAGTRHRRAESSERNVASSHSVPYRTVTRPAL